VNKDHHFFEIFGTEDTDSDEDAKQRVPFLKTTQSTAAALWLHPVNCRCNVRTMRTQCLYTLGLYCAILQLH